MKQSKGTIAKHLSVMMFGRIYSRGIIEVIRDRIFQKIPDAGNPIRPKSVSNLEADKGSDRWILSLDGGGLRGLMTLQVLKALESHYGKPTQEIFDMVAGTSTGAIIAAGLATGRTPQEIEDLYVSEATGIFESNAFFQRAYGAMLVGGVVVGAIGGIGFAAAILAALAFIPFIGPFLAAIGLAIMGAMTATLFIAGPIIAAAVGALIGPLIYSPKYTKNVRNVLQKYFGSFMLDSTELKMDLLITTKDMVRAREGTFTSFRRADGSRSTQHPKLNLARAVESSMSAPTFFDPIAACTDGGVGSYNNPVYLATVAALRLSGTGVYKSGEVSVVSIGTGFGDNTVAENFNTNMTLEWALYVMQAGFDDSRQLQTDIVRIEMGNQVRFIKRYDLLLTTDAMSTIGATGISQETLDDLVLDSVDQLSTFIEIGTAWANKLTADRALAGRQSVEVKTGETKPTPAEEQAYNDSLTNRLNSV